MSNISKNHKNPSTNKDFIKNQRLENELNGGFRVAEVSSVKQPHCIFSSSI